jgi:hypothetical protein
MDSQLDLTQRTLRLNNRSDGVLGLTRKRFTHRVLAPKVSPCDRSLATTAAHARPVWE